MFVKQNLSKFLTLFTVVMMTSCDLKNSKNDPIELAKPSSEKAKTLEKVIPPANLFVSGDTISIVGSHVLFFGPSEERIETGKVDRVALQAFNATANAVVGSIKNINPIATASITTVSFIRIYANDGSAPKAIDLSTFSEPFGMIVCDGTKLTPIMKGVRTRDVYESLIRNTYLVEPR